MSTVSPQRMKIVFQTRTVRRGTSVAPPGVSTEWTDEIMAEDTSVRECPHDEILIYDRERHNRDVRRSSAY